MCCKHTGFFGIGIFRGNGACAMRQIENAMTAAAGGCNRCGGCGQGRTGCGSSSGGQRRTNGCGGRTGRSGNCARDCTR